VLFSAQSCLWRCLPDDSVTRGTRSRLPALIPAGILMLLWLHGHIALALSDCDVYTER
jgi:hypothetical protein